MASGNTRGQSVVPGTDALRCAVPQRAGGSLSGERMRSRLRQRGGAALRVLPAQGTVRGIRGVRARTWPRSRIIRYVSSGAGPALAGGGRKGNALALSRRIGPVREGG